MKSLILNVQGYSIGVEYDDYICLTDMAKAGGQMLAQLMLSKIG